MAPMPELNPAFAAELRRLGRSTTPEELRRRGVQRVRSVGSADLSLLIERAVNRTLMERTIGPLDEAGMQEVVDQAQQHLSRQLRDIEELADSRSLLQAHREEMQGELGRLRAALAERRAFMEHEARGPAPLSADEHKQLLRRVHVCLAPLLPGGRLEGSAKAVAGDLVAMMHAHAAGLLAEQRRAFEDEMLKQERRVAKLVQSLERTEQVLARVARMKDLEEGVESLYRTVQGLSATDAASELKRAMLARIYEANVALRAGVRGATA